MQWLEAGSELSVPANVCHCIFTDIGVAFHEVVGDFQTRSTRFLYEGSRGRTVCGADGELRLMSTAVCNAVAGTCFASSALAPSPLCPRPYALASYAINLLPACHTQPPPATHSRQSASPPVSSYADPLPPCPP